jgi:hypothetical protein
MKEIKIEEKVKINQFNKNKLKTIKEVEEPEEEPSLPRNSEMNELESPMN